MRTLSRPMPLGLIAAGVFVAACSSGRGCSRGEATATATNEGALDASAASASPSAGAAADARNETDASSDAARRRATSNPYEATPVTHLTEVARFAVGAFPATTRKGKPHDPEGMIALQGKPFLYGGGTLRRLDDDLQHGTDVQMAKPSPKRTLAPLFADGGHLIAADGDGIAALDSTTGAIVWKQDEPSLTYYRSKWAAGPIRLGDVVAYLAGTYQKETLFVRSLATGALLWKREDVAGLVSDGARLITLTAGSPSLTIAARDVKTGTAVWSTSIPALASWTLDSFEASERHVAFLQAQDTKHGWGSDFKSMVLLDAATGAIRWTKKTAPQNRPFTTLEFRLFGDEVYELESPGLHRIDPNTGDALWTSGAAQFGLTRGRDALFVEGTAADDADGVLHALDPATGNEVWSYGVPSDTPYGFSPDETQFLDTDGGELVVAHDGASLIVFRRGATALAPLEKNVSFDVLEADTFKPDSPRKPYEAAIDMRVGAQHMTTDAHGHWQGTIRGRGPLHVWISNISGSYLPSISVDMENGKTVETIPLTLFPPEFPQACAPL